MTEIVGNTALLAALCAVVLAQVAKVLLILLIEKRLLMERIRETGGMPSSHSAGVAALATSVGLQGGFGSVSFAIAATLAVVVMYDATGIRRAAGEHAALLNELMREFSDLFQEGVKPKTLKTLLGHTYPQVFFGALTGVAIGVLFHLAFY